MSHEQAMEIMFREIPYKLDPNCCEALMAIAQ
jgi:HD-GYP domain-containing protein (c-di-GMP phosphodiesterase class II)